jgi:hypothetical protein
MDIDIADNTPLIDDKDGALGIALGAQDTILLAHLSMRPKVTQQGVSDATQAFCPGY